MFWHYLVFLFLTGGYLFIFFLNYFYVIFIKMGCELLTLN
ncbi:conserved domain protein (plasmid) [Escherichia coli 53638]|nr:conserved domain protein [Escherichia coli 53638]